MTRISAGPEDIQQRTPIAEFEPMRHLYRYLHLWWVAVILALVGALAGYLFARLNPPVYEAVAEFMVTIDMDKVPVLPLKLHDEDLALSATRGALISPDVINSVLAEAARLGWQIEWPTLIENTTIERRHAFWELRLRHTRPEVAEQLVNYWADLGYQTMLSWQAQDIAEEYVVFSPPTHAGRPIEPIYSDDNRLILAGSLVGWLVGLALIELFGARLFKIAAPTGAAEVPHELN